MHVTKLICHIRKLKKKGKKIIERFIFIRKKYIMEIFKDISTHIHETKHLHKKKLETLLLINFNREKITKYFNKNQI